MLLAALDWALNVLHVLVVLANLVCWWPRATRRFHLILVGLTASSWFGLGLFYGMGYCVLTDWHWMVKRARGARELPHSFVELALVDWLGLPLSATSVEVITATGFAIAALSSLTLNSRDWVARRRTRAHPRLRRA